MGKSSAIRNSLSKHYEFSVDTSVTNGYICTLNSDDYGNLTLTADDKTEVINIEIFAKELYTVSSYKSDEGTDSKFNLFIDNNNHLFFKPSVDKEYSCSLSGFLEISFSNTSLEGTSAIQYKYNYMYALKPMNLKTKMIDVQSVNDTTYYKDLSFTKDDSGKSEVRIHEKKPDGSVGISGENNKIAFLDNDSKIFVQTVEIVDPIKNSEDLSYRNLNLKTNDVYVRSIKANKWLITSPNSGEIVFRHD